MTRWVPGLDASFSRIDRAAFAQLYQMGYRVFVACLWTGAGSPAPAHDNLADALAEGFAISGYTNVNWRAADVPLDRAREAAGDTWDSLTVLAVDMELPTTEERALEVLTLASIAKDRVCAYSAKWAWDRYFASSTNPEFRRWPLWAADYDGDPDDPTRPFGPWTAADICGKQYQGTTEILPGVEVDLNTFDAEFWLPEEDAMNAADEVGLKAWVLQFGGGIKLVRVQGTDPVYLSDHHGKRLFPGGAAEFEACGFDWGDVQDHPADVIAAIPDYPAG